MADNPMSSIEPREYVLHEYGIAEPIKILGVLTQLLPGRDVPILFLIDEEHRNDTCTNQNIINAHELVQKARVTLIGVESHRGGEEWDDGNYKNTFDIGQNPEPVSDYAYFAERIRQQYPKTVFGVECLGMLNEQECNLSVDDNPWYGRQAKDHPLDECRSEHFVRTLLELRSRHGLSGNLILNAGGDHNSHIERWVKDGTIEAKARQKAAYVRLRAPAYQQ